MDGRIELYPFELWQRYRRIIRGDGTLPELDALGATHVLLQRSADQTLIELLDAAPTTWRAAYRDDTVLVYERLAAGEQN